MTQKQIWLVNCEEPINSKDDDASKSADRFKEGLSSIVSIHTKIHLYPG